jgi:hypothetical protein
MVFLKKYDGQQFFQFLDLFFYLKTRGIGPRSMDRLHRVGLRVYESIKTAGSLRIVELMIKGPDFRKRRVIFHSNLDHRISDGRSGFNMTKRFLEI